MRGPYIQSQTVAQAQRERDSNFEPPLRAKVADIASYDSVFLGFPIWGTTAPSVIRALLSAHDLSGRRLIPFITRGGYGLGNSLSAVARYAPRARLATKAFAIGADQVRRTLDQVTNWLKET